MAFTIHGKLERKKVSYTWDNGKITCSKKWALNHLIVELNSMKTLGKIIWTPARYYRYSENFLQDPLNAYVLICHCLDEFITNSGDVPKIPTDTGNIRLIHKASHVLIQL